MYWTLLMAHAVAVFVLFLIPAVEAAAEVSYYARAYGWRSKWVRSEMLVVTQWVLVDVGVLVWLDLVWDVRWMLL